MSSLAKKSHPFLHVLTKSSFFSFFDRGILFKFSYSLLNDLRASQPYNSLTLARRLLRFFLVPYPICRNQMSMKKEKTCPSRSDSLSDISTRYLCWKEGSNSEDQYMSLISFNYLQARVLSLVDRYLAKSSFSLVCSMLCSRLMEEEQLQRLIFFLKASSEVSSVPIEEWILGSVVMAEKERAGDRADMWSMAFSLRFNLINYWNDKLICPFRTFI